MNRIFNPDGSHPPRPHKLEETEGVKEHIDPELKEVFRIIDRGDLGVPSHALKAAAFQYAAQCNPVNHEFILCKNEELDPRRCLRYGEKVSDCASNFYRKVTDACGESFLAFAQCLEHNVHRHFLFCRPEQVKFDKCAFEKLGFDKARDAVAVHAKVKTDRPKPVNPAMFPNYDYPQPLLPDWNRPIQRPDV